MLKVKPTEKKMIRSESMKLLADFLKNDFPADKVVEAIEPLDSSIESLPEEYSIKEKIEEMITQTILLSKENGESSHKVYAMCASAIAGASTVVACFIDTE